MEQKNVFNIDLRLKKNQKRLPKNLYAIKVLNVDCNEIIYLSTEHDGYTPILETEHEKSNFFCDYLCNVEAMVVSEYFKSIKKEIPKEWYSLCEIMTDSKGELYHYSKKF